jgi:prophage DNA circulation protein
MKNKKITTLALKNKEKNMKNIKLTLALATVLGLVGCGSNPPTNDVEHVAYAIDKAPDWFTEPNESKDGVLFVTGTAKSTDMALARDKALLHAHSQLADQIHALVSSLTNKQTVETNSEVTIENIDQIVKKVVAEANMAGYKVVETELHAEGKYYRFYAMISFPVEQTLLLSKQTQKRKVTEAAKARLNKQINDLDNEIKRINSVGTKNWN